MPVCSPAGASAADAASTSTTGVLASEVAARLERLLASCGSEGVEGVQLQPLYKKQFQRNLAKDLAVIGAVKLKAFMQQWPWVRIVKTDHDYVYHHHQDQAKPAPSVAPPATTATDASGTAMDGMCLPCSVAVGLRPGPDEPCQPNCPLHPNFHLLPLFFRWLSVQPLQPLETIVQHQP